MIVVILQRICHPLRKKRKCYGKGDFEQERTKAINHVEEGLGKTPADYAELTWGNFFLANLLPVTIGNIIGGAVLVSLAYWFIYLRPSWTGRVRVLPESQDQVEGM